MHAAYHAHVTLTLKILGEGNKLLSTSLCNFLPPPITYPLLGPNIRSTPFWNTVYVLHLEAKSDTKF